MDKIKSLERILKKANAPILKYFNPGLPKEDIVKIFNQNGINQNPSLISLYEWHNGVSLSTEDVFQSVLEVMPMGIFYSLEDLIKTRKEIIEWGYTENPEEYLPLFDSGEDDIHLVKNSTGEIFYMAPAIQIFCELEFRSLDSLLDCVIECYEKSVFKIDTENGLVENLDEYVLIKKKYR